jgi:hypothetical protein
MGTLTDATVDGDFISGMPNCFFSDGCDCDSPKLQASLATGKWEYAGRSGDFADFISIAERATRAEAISVIRYLEEPLPAGKTYSEIFKEWYFRSDDGVVFDSGARYSPIELRTMKDLSSSVKRTVHESKKILSSPELDQGLRTIIEKILSKVLGNAV